MGNEKTTAFNKDKMKHVILYFLEHINNFHLGRTKLMKLLYYVDFDSFEQYGKSVTWARYRKLPLGPVPDHIDELIDEMEKNGEVKQVKAEVFKSKSEKPAYLQNRLVSANAKFDPSIFSGSELQIIERVAKCWEDATATVMKDASHKEAPWAATEEGKAIDYEMAHYRTPIGEEKGIDDLLADDSSFAKFISTLK
jgi:uncharacterized phage-associated protein